MRDWRKRWRIAGYRLLAWFIVVAFLNFLLARICPLWWGKVGLSVCGMIMIVFAFLVIRELRQEQKQWGTK